MEYGALGWFSEAHLMAGVMAQGSTGNVAVVSPSLGRA